MVKLTRSTRKETTAAKKDIVIPVMGAKGVGKSTFLNTLLMKVNPTSSTSTSALAVDYIDTIHGYDDFKDYRIVIIDTPGFDDTDKGDSEILKMVADLLEKSYKKAELGGVIYLHDISRDGFPGMAHRNLDMLQHFTGQNIVGNVVLGTTKWKLTDLVLGDQRQKQLQNDHWKPILEEGSQIRPFHDTYESAWGFIDDIMAILEERWETRESPKNQPHGKKSVSGTDVGQVSPPTLTEKDIVILVTDPPKPYDTADSELLEGNEIIPETEANKALLSALEEVPAGRQNKDDSVQKSPHEDARRKPDTEVDKASLSALGEASAVRHSMDDSVQKSPHEDARRKPQWVGRTQKSFDQGKKEVMNSRKSLLRFLSSKMKHASPSNTYSSDVQD